MKEIIAFNGVIGFKEGERIAVRIYIRSDSLEGLGREGKGGRGGGHVGREGGKVGGRGGGSRGKDHKDDVKNEPSGCFNFLHRIVRE